ncbi:phage integrase N-terminal SAM-like domain-containing protein [Peribacillus simplex]|uniref:phage integrase N-terminal SAM-like domain-containing protein n=1 Tax=Peribacillus simplex TaxID=1478 RepID=UPI0011DE4645|nr:phage integrase N-terminal SAM-like domain-containing protein [Peribacillus simplex]
MFIKDLLKEFTFDLQIKNYSKRTIETYNYNVGQLINFLETHHDISDVEDVSSLHIKKFIQYQKEIGNKPNYINTIIKSLRAFYSYLVNEEYVSLNAVSQFF